MIGKSYDGTLANGVAATGVEGLKTIVPVSAISAWYNYSRTGGVRHNTNYPAGPQRQRHDRGRHQQPARREPAAAASRPAAPWSTTTISATTPTSTPATATRTATSTSSGATATTSRTRARSRPPVFATHGFQDDNVRMDHMGMWWDALKANNVPRKLWLLRAGHEDPFESRRAEWVDTLHRWFDHYLFGVDNGIRTSPQSRSRTRRTSGATTPSWPIPGTQNVDSSCARPATAAPGNARRPWPAAARPTRSASRATNPARPR